MASVLVPVAIAIARIVLPTRRHQISRSLSTLSSVPSISPDSPTSNVDQAPNKCPFPARRLRPTAPAGENITRLRHQRSRTIACNGGTVSVSGITNKVVITGHCASLSVSGIQNQITVDAADTIQASGSGNQVTYHTGSPRIGNSGYGNVVQRG